MEGTKRQIKIGQLCWFWGTNINPKKYLGRFKGMSEAGFFYVDENCMGWANCRPVTKKDMNYLIEKYNEGLRNG